MAKHAELYKDIEKKLTLVSNGSYISFHPGRNLAPLTSLLLREAFPETNIFGEPSKRSYKDLAKLFPESAWFKGNSPLVDRELFDIIEQLISTKDPMWSLSIRPQNRHEFDEYFLKVAIWWADKVSKTLALCSVPPTREEKRDFLEIMFGHLGLDQSLVGKTLDQVDELGYSELSGLANLLIGLKRAENLARQGRDPGEILSQLKDSKTSFRERDMSGLGSGIKMTTLTTTQTLEDILDWLNFKTTSCDMKFNPTKLPDTESVHFKKLLEEAKDITGPMKRWAFSDGISPWGISDTLRFAWLLETELCKRDPTRKSMRNTDVLTDERILTEEIKFGPWDNRQLSFTTRWFMGFKTTILYTPIKCWSHIPKDLEDLVNGLGAKLGVMRRLNCTPSSPEDFLVFSLEDTLMIAWDLFLDSLPPVIFPDQKIKDSLRSYLFINKQKLSIDVLKALTEQSDLRLPDIMGALGIFRIESDSYRWDPHPDYVSPYYVHGICTPWNTTHGELCHIKNITSPPVHPFKGSQPYQGWKETNPGNVENQRIIQWLAKILLYIGVEEPKLKDLSTHPHLVSKEGELTMISHLYRRITHRELFDFQVGKILDMEPHELDDQAKVKLDKLARLYGSVSGSPVTFNVTEKKEIGYFDPKNAILTASSGVDVNFTAPPTLADVFDATSGTFVPVMKDYTLFTGGVAPLSVKDVDDILNVTTQYPKEPAKPEKERFQSILDNLFKKKEALEKGEPHVEPKYAEHLPMLLHCYALATVKKEHPELFTAESFLKDGDYFLGEEWRKEVEKLRNGDWENLHFSSEENETHLVQILRDTFIEEFNLETHVQIDLPSFWEAVTRSGVGRWLWERTKTEELPPHPTTDLIRTAEAFANQNISVEIWSTLDGGVFLPNLKTTFWYWRKSKLVTHLVPNFSDSEEGASIEKYLSYPRVVFKDPNPRVVFKDPNLRLDPEDRQDAARIRLMKDMNTSEGVKGHFVKHDEDRFCRLRTLRHEMFFLSNFNVRSYEEWLDKGQPMAFPPRKDPKKRTFRSYNPFFGTECPLEEMTKKTSFVNILSTPMKTPLASLYPRLWHALGVFCFNPNLEQPNKDWFIRREKARKHPWLFEDWLEGLSPISEEDLISFYELSLARIEGIFTPDQVVTNPRFEGKSTEEIVEYLEKYLDNLKLDVPFEEVYPELVKRKPMPKSLVSTVSSSLLDAAKKGAQQAAAHEFNMAATNLITKGICNAFDVPVFLLESGIPRSFLELATPLLLITAVEFMEEHIPGADMIHQGAKLALTAQGFKNLQPLFSALRPHFNKLEEAATKIIEVEAYEVRQPEPAFIA